MQDLTPRQSHATKTIELLSPGLRLLLTTGDNETAVSELASNGRALQEAGDVLAALERDAQRPAGPTGVRRVVERRFVLYPQPQRAPEEWVHWWNAYYDVLADIPEGTLEASMIAWAKTAAEFLPKPGQILELTADNAGKDALACFRIRAAQRQREWADKPDLYIPGTPDRPEVTPEERAKVKAMLNDFRANLPEKKIPQGPRSNPARVGPTGVSPELKALVERQRAER